MENLNDLKILFSFVPSFKDKSILQLGSDHLFTELFTQDEHCAKGVTVVGSDQGKLEENKKCVQFIKSDFKHLNLNNQK